MMHGTINIKKKTQLSLKKKRLLFYKIVACFDPMGLNQAFKMCKTRLILYCFHNKNCCIGLCYLYVVKDSFVFISVIHVHRYETSISHTGTYFRS